MKTFRTLLVVLSLALGLCACSNKAKVPKPKILLTEQQMIDMLADIYLIEADLNQRKSVGEQETKLEETYYQQLFEHYGVSDSVFNENMAYYTTQLNTLEWIMDSVKQRLENAKSSQ